MTTILPFIIRRRPPAETRVRGTSAEIVIFPGVRYETFGNGEKNAADAPHRRGVRAKRKKTNA